MFFLVKLWARMFYGSEAVEEFEEKHRREKARRRPIKQKPKRRKK